MACGGADTSNEASADSNVEAAVGCVVREEVTRHSSFRAEREFVEWMQADFGPLDYATTMRLVVPGVTLTALGFQTVLSSFFMSILGMNRR